MTLEEILQFDAEKLEAMTDEELLEHFKIYLDVTRPERQTPIVREQQKVLAANPKLLQGVNLLKSLGVDVGSSLVPVKRRK